MLKTGVRGTGGKPAAPILHENPIDPNELQVAY